MHVQSQEYVNMFWIMTLIIHNFQDKKIFYIKFRLFKFNGWRWSYIKMVIYILIYRIYSNWTYIFLTVLCDCQFSTVILSFQRMQVIKRSFTDFQYRFSDIN